MRLLLLVLSLACAASSAPPAPAPWPVAGHDSAGTYCNPMAHLMSKYCNYDLRVPPAVSGALVPAPDAAVVPNIFSENGEIIIEGWTFPNLTKSRAAVNFTITLPNIAPTSVKWLGFASTGTQLAYLSACTSDNMYLSAFAPPYKTPLWTRTLGECTFDITYNTYADAIDVHLLSTGTLMRVSGARGKTLWSSALRPLAAFRLGLPSGDIVMLGLSNNVVSLTTVNGRNGDFLWQENITGLGTLMIADQEIAVINILNSAGEWALLAFNAPSGAEVWKSQLSCASGEVFLTFATLNGSSVLAAACSNPIGKNYIAAIDPGLGVVKAQYAVPYIPTGIQGTADSTLVVTAIPNLTTHATQLGIFDLTTGSTSWVVTVQDYQIQNVVIDQRGRIFYTANSTYVLDAC